MLEQKFRQKFGGGQDAFLKALERAAKLKEGEENLNEEEEEVDDDV